MLPGKDNGFTIKTFVLVSVYFKLERKICPHPPKKTQKVEK
jgi:hypothetical protein